MEDKRTQQLDWRQIAWHVGVRERNGRHKKWTLTCQEWFSTRRSCAEYIKKEIDPFNWETYFYKPVKLIMAKVGRR